MNRFIRQLQAVFAKEWLDARRDLRTLTPILMMPMIMVAGVTAMVLLVVSMAKDSEQMTLAVSGAEHLPELVQWFDEQGISVADIDKTTAPEDLYAQVAQGTLNMVLVLTPEETQKFSQGKTVKAWLVADSSRNELQAERGRVQNVLEQFSARFGALRLIARGVSPELARPLMVETVDVASSQKRTMMLLAGIPMTLMMTMFVAGMGLAAEMAAGEREKRSLEPLLITPVSRRALIWGKLLAVMAFSLIAVLFADILYAITLTKLPLSEIGVRLSLGLSDHLAVMSLAVIVVFMAASLQLFVATFARSFKDAQTYMGLLVMLPMAAYFYSIFNSADASPILHWLPVLGPQLLLLKVFQGEGLALAAFWPVAISGIAMGLVFALLTEWQLKREKTIYAL